MNEYIFILSALILVSILTILVWFVVVKILKERDTDFVVNYNVLLNVIELYIETILRGKINILSRQFDLNENSKTNSILAFEKAKDELISNSVKDIMNMYLSKNCLRSLLRHYNVEGLSLLIITHLKR